MADAPAMTSPPTAAAPAATFERDHVVITWADGHTSRYGLADLKKRCPCEKCRPLTRHWRRVLMTWVAMGATVLNMILGWAFCFASAEAAAGFGLLLIGVTLVMAGLSWWARYPRVWWLSVSHVGIFLLLLFLVVLNHWNPREAQGPFLVILTAYLPGMLALTWYVFRRPPPVKEEPTWACRHCGYTLYGLGSERRCPECGQGFDPAQFPSAPPAGVIA